MLRIGPSDLSAPGRRHSPHPDRRSGGSSPPPPQGGSPAQARLLLELEHALQMNKSEKHNGDGFIVADRSGRKLPLPRLSAPRFRYSGIEGARSPRWPLRVILSSCSARPSSRLPWMSCAPFAAARPIVSWANRTGVVTATWLPAVGRFLYLRVRELARESCGNIFSFLKFFYLLIT